MPLTGWRRFSGPSESAPRSRRRGACQGLPAQPPARLRARYRPASRAARHRQHRCRPVRSAGQSAWLLRSVNWSNACRGRNPEHQDPAHAAPARSAAPAGPPLCAATASQTAAARAAPGPELGPDLGSDLGPDLAAVSQATARAAAIARPAAASVPTAARSAQSGRSPSGPVGSGRRCA